MDVMESNKSLQKESGFPKSCVASRLPCVVVYTTEESMQRTESSHLPFSACWLLPVVHCTSGHFYESSYVDSLYTSYSTC